LVEERAAELQILNENLTREIHERRRASDIFDLLHKHLGIRYIYEEVEKSKGEHLFGLAQDRLQSKIKDVLTPTVLTALPPNVITNLEHAVSRSDMELINALIDEIRYYNATVADALAYLANEFNYDEILRIIQKAK
jgi:hypothetical protein